MSDPCERESTDATHCLTNQQKEEVTASAQVCLISIFTKVICVDLLIEMIVVSTRSKEINILNKKFK